MDRKKLIMIGCSALAALLIIITIAMWIHEKNYWAESDTMPSNIILNGIDCSDMDKKEVKKLLEKKSNSHDFVINENGSEAIEFDLSGTKYRIMNYIDNAVAEQGYFGFIGHKLGNEYTYDVPMHVRKTTDEFKREFSEFIEEKNEGKTITKDAYVDITTDNFTIVDEVYGDSIDKAALKKDILSAIETGTYSLDYSDEKYVAVPNITADSKAIKERLEFCEKYLRTEISYEFGSIKETLTPTQLDSMISLENGKIHAKKSSVKKVVSELKENYDTYTKSRTFKTTEGRTVTLNPGTYGYIIDKDAEVKQLISDIESGKNVSREPVYSVSGNGREGVDDILDTYIEVDLTAQHMYYYVDGEVSMESDFVSGMLKKDKLGQSHGTVPGVFKIAYKDKDAVLKGGDKSKGTDYESEVEYWMPFFNGIGFHDAPWRTEFGGKIYISNGSHGCINLPVKSAKELFETVKTGTIVVVFY